MALIDGVWRPALKAFRALARAGRTALRRGGRCVRWAVFLLIVAAATVLAPGDRDIVTPAEEAAAGNRYALVSWEARHAPAKWLHRIYTLMPWSGTGAASRKQHLDVYLELARELRDAQAALEKGAAGGHEGDGATSSLVSMDMDALIQRRDRLRDSVEEYLESALSRVVVQEGLNAAGGIVWPPVDFRLDRTPRVLVTSPRDRIERLETVLIAPDVAAAEVERIEGALLDEEDISAIIEATGGLATYPTVIPGDQDLLPLLEVAAHEWLHSYLYFRPLGQKYNDNAEMTTLNETLADMAGREIGGMAYAFLTGRKAPLLEPPRDPSVAPARPGEFDAFMFMRETRQRTDDLLRSGDIVGAESYMEERRAELNTHGYKVRKINQAYFAFHGSYGESPSSVSPIARELFELRRRSASVGEFVRSVRGVSSYAQFKQTLDGLRASAAG